MRLYNAVHILVGTPGRILDLAHKNVVKLSHCTMVVMDEADKKVSLFPHLASLFHLWSSDAHLDVLCVIAVGNQSVIFCKSATPVELLTKRITEQGISCFYIHAKMPEAQRNRVFHEFRNGATIHSLVSTLSKSSRACTLHTHICLIMLSNVPFPIACTMMCMCFMCVACLCIMCVCV